MNRYEYDKITKGCRCCGYSLPPSKFREHSRVCYGCDKKLSMHIEDNDIFPNIKVYPTIKESVAARKANWLQLRTLYVKIIGDNSLICHQIKSI